MYKIVTSNEEKLKEYKRFGIKDIEMEKGRDLEEVDSTPLDVIIYKAIEAGEGLIVEDVSLHIEGEDVGVNIRWLLHNISEYAGKKAMWQVLIGYNDGENIIVSEGLVGGRITDKFKGNHKGFGFDCYFVPFGKNNEEETLYELEEKNKKDEFSARKQAIEKFINGEYKTKKKISEIPKWEGKMQS